MLEENSRTYLSKLAEIHDRSGLSLREVARECDLDPQLGKQGTANRPLE